MIPQIILRRGKEESLLRRHPWIFSGAIEKVKCEGELKDGEVAGLESEGLVFEADWAVNCNLIDTTAIDKRKYASESDVQSCSLRA